MTTIYFATNRRLLPSDDLDVFGKGFSEDGLANLRFSRAAYQNDGIEAAASGVV